MRVKRILRILAIEDALTDGFILRDELEFEAGMCCNGGHYGISYKINDSIVYSRSDYEDDYWKQDHAFKSARHLARFAAERWNDRCYYHDGLRFVFESPY